MGESVEYRHEHPDPELYVTQTGNLMISTRLDWALTERNRQQHVWVNSLEEMDVLLAALQWHRARLVADMTPTIAAPRDMDGDRTAVVQAKEQNGNA